MRAAMITVSTSRAAGAEDTSGPRLAAFAERLGRHPGARDLPDERGMIEARLLHWAMPSAASSCSAPVARASLPATSRPTATRAVIEREAPGYSRGNARASREHTAHWMLSRGVAGIRGTSLIINFPGSPKASTRPARRSRQRYHTRSSSSPADARAH